MDPFRRRMAWAALWFGRAVLVLWTAVLVAGLLGRRVVHLSWSDDRWSVWAGKTLAMMWGYYLLMLLCGGGSAALVRREGNHLVTQTMGGSRQLSLAQRWRAMPIGRSPGMGTAAWLIGTSPLPTVVQESRIWAVSGWEHCGEDVVAVVRAADDGRGGFRGLLFWVVCCLFAVCGLLVSLAVLR